jgi:hypothetical protein
MATPGTGSAGCGAEAGRSTAGAAAAPASTAKGAAIKPPAGALGRKTPAGALGRPRAFPETKRWPLSSPSPSSLVAGATPPWSAPPSSGERSPGNGSEFAEAVCCCILSIAKTPIAAAAPSTSTTTNARASLRAGRGRNASTSIAETSSAGSGEVRPGAEDHLGAARLDGGEPVAGVVSGIGAVLPTGRPGTPTGRAAMSRSSETAVSTWRRSSSAPGPIPVRVAPLIGAGKAGLAACSAERGAASKSSTPRADSVL